MLQKHTESKWLSYGKNKKIQQSGVGGRNRRGFPYGYSYRPLTQKDKLRVFTTVGFPALQFNAVKKQFVATRKVPLEVIEQSQDRPFAALVLDVKAVTQITGSFP